MELMSLDTDDIIELLDFRKFGTHTKKQKLMRVPHPKNDSENVGNPHTGTHLKYFTITKLSTTT